MSNTNERDASITGNSLLDTVRASCGSGNGNRPRELDLKGVHWAGENLTHLDLSGYDFSGADLSGADLSGSNLTWCQLAGADLHKAILVDCEFLSSDLSSANLNEVTANRVGLGATDLTGASLVGADLREATLSEAKLVRADLRAANLSGSSIRGANLERAVFTRAELENVDLKYSNVRHTDFHVANLNNARLLGLKNYDKAIWVGADIRMWIIGVHSWSFAIFETKTIFLSSKTAPDIMQFSIGFGGLPRIAVEASCDGPFPLWFSPLYLQVFTVW